MLLNCRWLLYVVFFLAACDLYIFAVNGELFFVVLFVLIGFLTTFFSKNMTVILLIAMTLTNILRFGKDVRVKEGMEGGSEATGTTSSGSATVQVGKGDDEGGDYQFLDKEEEGDTKKGASKKGGAAKPPIIESIVSGDAANGSPIGATAASPTAAPVDSGIDSKLKGLDQDTVELLKKQKNLMESMRNLEPMLSKAESFLDDLKKKI